MMCFLGRVVGDVSWCQVARMLKVKIEVELHSFLLDPFIDLI